VQPFASYLLLLLIVDIGALGSATLTMYYAGDLPYLFAFRAVKVFLLLNLIAAYAVIVLSLVRFLSSWFIIVRLQNFKEYEQSILAKWSDAFIR
jgi:hypothetical protein